MSLVSPSQSSPGGEITAAAINTPVNQLAAVVNGLIDSTNITANGVGTTQIADSAVTGTKLSGTYKTTRQNDTTNTTETAARILTGWGVITPGAVNAASETVTFTSAFTSAPIVTLTYGGDAAAATTYGSGGISIKDSAIAIAHTITTTGFTARFVVRDATNWAAGNTVFYQWIAIGT